MPELPEVETVARYLGRALVGKTLTSAKLLWPRMLTTPSTQAFYAGIVNMKVRACSRRGKYLLVELETFSKGFKRTSSQSKHLVFHLRMSGALQVFAKSSPRDKHDRAIFELDSDEELRFNDIRKFGRIALVEDALQTLSSLGPEPFDPKLDAASFHTMLLNRKRLLKPLLLDQGFVAGIGNIYADEALWRAKLHPKRSAHTLSRHESSSLLRAIRATLTKAIECQGTDIGDNVVEFGNYSPKVYQRTGKSCRRCRTHIKRIVVGQRGTHFCPNCQKVSRADR